MIYRLGFVIFPKENKNNDLSTPLFSKSAFGLVKSLIFTLPKLLVQTTAAAPIFRW